MIRVVRFAVGALALALSAALYAADTGGVSLIPSASAAPAPAGLETHPPVSLAGDALVFSAPPHESAEEAQRLYQPVADYLTRALARPVTYSHPKTWLSYQKEMARGTYDIVFDGAHFNSWRIAHLKHNAIAKIPEQQVFAVVTRKDDARATNLKQLAGKPVCAAGASNLATLTLLAEFEPMRQPLVVEQLGWSKVYDGLLEGRCAAATLPVAMLRKLDPGSKLTRVLHQSKPLPNETFSAGPRLSAEEQLTLANALTSLEGKRVLAPLLAENGAARGLALATRDDYAGMDAYLKDVWGYAR